jgi:1,4-alpha-glucan branching enzyme
MTSPVPIRPADLLLASDAAAFAREGAEEFVRLATGAAERGGRFVVALTGGGSPVGMYGLLGTEEFSARVPWDRLHLCWGDERAVPPHHPRSNFGMAWRLFVGKVPIPATNVHRMRGELGAARGAEEYEAELRALFGGDEPRFDLVHLGLGDNGHILSLFPFQTDVLLERERWVVPALNAELGEPRITLTVPALNAAARIEFLIPEARKAGVAARAMLGPLDPLRVPAQLARPADGRLAWRLTRDAAPAVTDTSSGSGTTFASATTDLAPAPTRPASMKDAALSQEIRKIVNGEHHDVFAVLGPHQADAGGASATAVRAFVPWASELEVVDAETGEVTRMNRLHPAGFFQALFPDRLAFRYRLRATDADGVEVEFEDPYSFPSTLGELDLHLLGEGTDLQMYRKLGAHPARIAGVEGVRFAVWAPNAERVSVVGDFDHWDGRRHVMRLHPGVGVWDIFIPGLERGALYKYEIKPRDGAPFLKSDPVGFRTELRPATASIVHGLSEYAWTDQEWMARRGTTDYHHEPLLVYEVHLGSWRWAGDRPLTYRELAEQLPDYVAQMGFTHVELMPVMEHPYDPSWGYQVTGYFAPTSRFGEPDDFRFLVDRLHERGIGVILDWVPAHFPKDAAGLRRFDGSALYEHEDPRQGEHPDWGTLIFNYSRNEVRNFLVANALFWLNEYHADGLRVDAVASMLYLDYSRNEGEWLPNRYGGRENLDALDFIRHLNQTVSDEAPGALMIAEESTAWPGVTQPVAFGGLGFHFKWNMGWMNDFLRFVEHDPIYRKYNFGLLTFSLMYAFSERFILPISHDEVVHGKRSLLDKMPGDVWRRFADLRLALGFMWGHPGKQLLFMGCEIGQWREWQENGPLDWYLLDDPMHRGLQRWVEDLNRVYRGHPALWERDDTYEGFEWIDFHDVENSVLAFLRRGANPEEEVIFVCNFTPVPRHDYRIGVSRPGVYREVLNSDAECYGGSNVGNGGGVEAESGEVHGRPCSICLTLPPLGVLILKRDPGEQGS